MDECGSNSVHDVQPNNFSIFIDFIFKWLEITCVNIIIFCWCVGNIIFKFYYLILLFVWWWIRLTMDRATLLYD